MTRPLRLEFPGALYHVTSRGDRRTFIFIDDIDREEWLSLAAAVCARFHFHIHAYCLMGSHFHIMVETIEGNLSRGMCHLNGTYSQYFNRRHHHVGHVFQGRYKAILVQKENYLLELARYIVLNPVRAKLVPLASDWLWSNHNALTGKVAAPSWLVTDWLLGQFGNTRDTARAAYQNFVAEGVDSASPLCDTCHQMILGDEAFVGQHAARLDGTDFTEIPKVQRQLAVRPLQAYQDSYDDRDEAMARAYFSTAYTMRQIGVQFCVSYKTVGRAVKLWESRLRDH